MPLAILALLCSLLNFIVAADLQDKEDIKDLTAAFLFLIDNKKFNELGKVPSPDVTYDPGNGPLQGLPAATAALVRYKDQGKWREAEDLYIHAGIENRQVETIATQPRSTPEVDGLVTRPWFPKLPILIFIMAVVLIADFLYSIKYGSSKVLSDSIVLVYGFLIQLTAQTLTLEIFTALSLYLDSNTPSWLSSLHKRPIIRECLWVVWVATTPVVLVSFNYYFLFTHFALPMYTNPRGQGLEPSPGQVGDLMMVSNVRSCGIRKDSDLSTAKILWSYEAIAGSEFRVGILKQFHSRKRPETALSQTLPFHVERSAPTPYNPHRDPFP